MPAPKANLNSAKNGTRLTRLTLGELPKAMRRQLANVRQYRRDLEAAVLHTKGEINTTDTHLIDECTQAQTHAAVCKWLMRTRIESMTVSDIRACSEQILKAATIRNRAVERLGLDHRRDPWSIIDALPAPRPEEQNEQ